MHERFDFAEVGFICMNGRLYDPLLRRFLNADENIQDAFNTQNYNKYGYVLNNPLMYNDPSGEVIVSFIAAVAISAIVSIGMDYYMNRPVNLENLAQSMIIAAVSSGISYGIGEVFRVAADTGKYVTKIAKDIYQFGGKLAIDIVKSGTHAVSQGILSMVQGNKFGSGFLSGLGGSLGASGWKSVFGSSGVSMIAFGALAGGIGAELSGGNFWQGAITGGIVAGLNHAMHMGDNDDEFRKNDDGSITATGGKKGGDATDYLYDKNGKLIETKKVISLVAGDNMTADYSTYGLRLHTEGTGLSVLDGLQSAGELALLGKAGSFLSKYKVPFFKGLSIAIKKYAPSLNQGQGFRIGISQAKINGKLMTVFRATYGNRESHYFNIILGKHGTIKY
ncbi:hypothetical protein N4T42_12265 [Riemerella anatipestifer]|uniref:RHS repeat-associated core domain-containing protein n=1 Tax=Riemerella anatipestifer TaxID=34085 RepID=UPI0021D6118A|nr:RHS repeat-associated core domain-containing protein [Riemerella anatipestifer]MCU7561063.1 hypothetical protein [Riemerella anatipestifer]